MFFYAWIENFPYSHEIPLPINSAIPSQYFAVFFAIILIGVEYCLCYFFYNLISNRFYDMMIEARFRSNENYASLGIIEIQQLL